MITLGGKNQVQTLQQLCINAVFHAVLQTMKFDHLGVPNGAISQPNGLKFWMLTL